VKLQEAQKPPPPSFRHLLPIVRPSLLIPLIVGCALFMENMDATVLATSLPALARDLNQDPITLKLAMTAYVAALGVFIRSRAGWPTSWARARCSAQP
jgi:MFS family permease